MKIKLRSLLLAVGIVVTVMGASTAQVGAAANPPHGRQIAFSVGNCLLRFVQGNAYGGAYAKINESVLSNCGGLTYVRVTAYANKRLVSGPACGIGFWDPGCMNGNGWRQSFVPYSTIVSSEVRICTSHNRCEMRHFSGV